MDMQGEYRIPATRQTVWDALNDPEVLKACIAGCESLERTEDGGFEASVTAKVGPVKATFKGAVRLENVNAPESYTIVGEGKGGAAGFAKGGADVKLVEDGSDTILTYTVNAQVGGKLAQIGARLVDSTAKKYATDFFDKFVVIAQQRETGDRPVAETAATETSEPAATPGATPDAMPPVMPPEAAPVPPSPAQETERVQEDATNAALDSVTQQKATRKGMTPMQWILILIVVLFGLTMFFGGDGTMSGVGN